MDLALSAPCRARAADNAVHVNYARPHLWKWGTDYFGRGRLRAQEGGRVLTGTWGYTRAAEGAGTWQLRRVER